MHTYVWYIDLSVYKGVSHDRAVRQSLESQVFPSSCCCCCYNTFICHLCIVFAECSTIWKTNLLMLFAQLYLENIALDSFEYQRYGSPTNQNRKRMMQGRHFVNEYTKLLKILGVYACTCVVVTWSNTSSRASWYYVLLCK